MNHNLYWTEEAHDTFDYIVLTIEEKWGVEQAGVFVKRVKNVLQIISQQPYLFKASITNDVRKTTISKQKLLYFMKLLKHP